MHVFCDDFYLLVKLLDVVMLVNEGKMCHTESIQVFLKIFTRITGIKHIAFDKVIDE